MKNIELLCYGIKHIARNHGFEADVNYEDSGEVCIFGGCNVPTLSDVQMLCDDVNLDSSSIETQYYGIYVRVCEEWLSDIGQKNARNVLEFWKRKKKE